MRGRSIMNKVAVSRRAVLRGSVAIAATALASPKVSAQGTKVLKVHATKDMANIDPSERVDVNDERIMSLIYSSLVRQKEGREWGWELDIANQLRRSTRRMFGSRCAQA